MGHNFLRLRKGRGHEKWVVKRGRVMQMYALDHVEAHPQKKKEVLYLVKKKGKKKNNETLWIETVKYYTLFSHMVICPSNLVYG